jgi:hypothetical protein
MDETAGSLTTTVSLKLPTGASRFHMSFSKELGDPDMAQSISYITKPKMATSHPRETCWKEYFDPAIYLSTQAPIGAFLPCRPRHIPPETSQSSPLNRTPPTMT